MAKIVTAVFDGPMNAQLAVQDLLNHGFRREDISMQMTEGSIGREFCIDVSSKAPEYGVVGTVFGAVCGAVFAALVARGYIASAYLILPHHNILITTLAGAGVGSMFGLLLGLAAGAGVPEYESSLYAVDKRKSRILLGIYCHERREVEVRKLLEANSGGELRSRAVALSLCAWTQLL
jgi:hypothetical protein